MEEALAPGDRVRPGDLLSFQVQVSVPTYVYMVNEDDEGASFLMFPLPVAVRCESADTGAAPSHSW